MPDAPGLKVGEGLWSTWSASPVQAFAAVLGGSQSLPTNSFDEAIALPTERSARLALRTQQVLADETDVTATVDPFAGSYVVEELTDEVEAAALELMAKGCRDDRSGGWVRPTSCGRMQHATLLAQHGDEGIALDILGQVHAAAGRRDQAHDQWRDAYTLLDKLGHPGARPSSTS